MRPHLVENCCKLDLAWLMRLGPIRTGRSGRGTIAWTINGCPAGSARFRLDLRDAARARLVIRFRADGSRDATTQFIALTALPQHFGGVRWWMLCPATGRRARTLLLPPGGERFASREALGLCYHAERLTRFDRPFEKLRRAQRRARCDDGLGAPLRRPKGMWQRTYSGHLARIEQRDLACLDHIARFIAATE